MATKTKKRSVSTSTTPVSEKAPLVAKTNGRGTATTAEFNPDYTYVKKDLKRIGILASSFFVVLVVLSFFLR